MNFTIFGRTYRDLSSFLSKTKLSVHEVTYIVQVGFTYQEAVALLMGYYAPTFYFESTTCTFIYQNKQYKTLDILARENNIEGTFFRRTLNAIPQADFRKLKVGYLYKGKLFLDKSKLCNFLKITEEEFGMLEPSVFMYRLQELRLHKKKEREREYRQLQRENKQVSR